MTTKKAVQTELGADEYKVLAYVAKRKGLTIEEAVRQALLEWTMSGVDLRQDPLFRLKPVRFREKVGSSEIDRFLYYARRKGDMLVLKKSRRTLASVRQKIRTRGIGREDVASEVQRVRGRHAKP